MKGIAWALVSAALLLSSCAAPLCETAEIRKGVSWGGGLGAGILREEGDDFYRGNFTFLLRDGVSERLAVGAQGGCSLGVSSFFGFEAYINAKLRLWRGCACLLGVGFPRLYDVNMLMSAGNIISMRIGGTYLASDYCALDCTIDVHPRLTRRIRYHVSGTRGLYRYPGETGPYGGDYYSAGIGLEFLPGSK